jgi:predicted enzyme related to lactoylglutathione lyase
MKKNPVVHFEMPYENHERLMKFYNQTFGWELNKFGNDMGNYVTAATAETDENRMVKTPGTINGGFFPKGNDAPAMPSVVISVDDINDTITRIKAAGGKIHGEPQQIPGVGMWVPFTDSEGNRVSIMQPAQN